MLVQESIMTDLTINNGLDVLYEIDDKDCLVFFNEQWQTFAHANQAAYLAAPDMLHRSLWGFIVDRETRLIYEMMFDKVRKSSQSIHFQYRCDSPTMCRYMQMELHGDERGHVHFRSQMAQVEDRDHVALIEPDLVRSSEFVTICSWCKCVQLPNAAWVEVEEAISALGLFNAAVLPQLTHGICASCLESFRGWRNQPLKSTGSS